MASQLRRRGQRRLTVTRPALRPVRPLLEALESRLAPADYRVTAQLQVLQTDAGSAAPGQQVVFFESSVADYQVLQRGLSAGTDAVVLDAGGDGLDQVAAFLRGRHDLAAVHLVSHGAPGAVLRGGPWGL